MEMLVQMLLIFKHEASVLQSEETSHRGSSKERGTGHMKGGEESFVGFIVTSC